MANRAAIGLRPHTGWAVAVALGGDSSVPHVLDRGRLELLGDASLPAPTYHAARKLELVAAQALVRRAEASAHAAAERGLAELITELRERDYRVVAAGVVSGDRPLPSFEAILASHVLVHAAEGRMYAEALAGAAERLGLPVVRVPQRELHGRAVSALDLPDDALRGRLRELGRDLGAPWRQDQQDAAAAAWLALVTEYRRS